MKILLTGERGNLAINIIKALTEFSEFEICNTTPWRTLRPSSHHHWPELDICTSNLRDAICTLNPDIIIHSAAIVNTDKCSSNPQLACNINLMGTYNILQMCKEYNIKLIYFSTTATYNPSILTNRPFIETTLQKPPTLYGITKYAGELLVTGQNIVPWIIIRPCFIYGDAPLDHSSQLCRIAVHQVLKSLKHSETGSTPIITLDPELKKDYMRVEDFATAIVTMLKFSDLPWGNIFNISRQTPKQMRIYFKNLELALNLGPLDMKWDKEADYMGDHIVDSSRFRAIFNWKQKIKIQDGIKMTADAAKNYVNQVQLGNLPLLYK